MQSMYFPPITVSDISKAISEMDITKTPGIDRIRVKDLQFLIKRICPILAKLLNLTVQDGMVPKGLKLSIVRPVYKKEDHMLFSNYRPIYLSCRKSKK